MGALCSVNVSIPKPVNVGFELYRAVPEATARELKLTGVSVEFQGKAHLEVADGDLGTFNKQFAELPTDLWWQVQGAPVMWQP